MPTRRVPGAAALIAEAGIDHAGITDLIWQLRDLTPAAELYDARGWALAEQVGQQVAGARSTAARPPMA